MKNNILVKLEYQGLPCWHIITVNPIKRPLLKKFVAGEKIDVSEIGEIQISGWGWEAPDETKEQFNV